MDEHNNAQVDEQERVDTEHDAPQSEMPNDAPDETRDEQQQTARRRTVPRLALIGLGFAGAVIVLVFGLMTRAGDDAEAPTLEAQVQQQQQALDQLRAQLAELQQQVDEGVNGVRGRVSGLDRRVDELSASVDVRFGAVQEKQQALEQAVEAEDRRRSGADEASPTTQDQEPDAEPDDLPSFDADPIRHLTQNLSAPKSDAEAKDESPPASASKPDAEADTQPEKVVAEAAPEPEPKPQPKPRRRYTPPTPTFTVSGLEIRGGNRFLAVTFGEGRRLSDLRLIGVGQSVGSWHLSSIYGHTATFIVNGKSVDVSIP